MLSKKTCTKATCCKNYTSFTSIPEGICRISYDEIKISTDTKSTILGNKGVFGKCIHTKLGPLDVCIKVYKEGLGSSHFHNEAMMLAGLCHSDLPWLFGVNDHKSYHISVISYIAFYGVSVTIHQAIYKPPSVCSSLCNGSWKSIILGCWRPYST